MMRTATKDAGAAPVTTNKSLRSASSLTLTSPSSLGSTNSILSPFSDAGSQSPGAGLWSKDLQALDHASNQTVASDNSVASIGVSFEQSDNKFDLNGDDTYSDFYDEIRSKSGTTRAARSMSLDSACPGHISISPRQLADIFSIFHKEDEEETTSQPTSDLSSLYQPAKPVKNVTVDETDSDAATEVTSNTFSPSTVAYNPKIESLQRECDTLKQIISSDSTKMLQLQTERKRLQENFDKCAAEKKALEKQVRSLEMEKKTTMERQRKQDEKIRYLQAELQRMPPDKTYAGASLHDIEELRLANELLASQVIYAERELQQANSDNDSNKENIPPVEAPTTPKAYENKRDWGVSQTAASETEGVLEDITPRTLSMQLKMLETRLKAVEDDNLSRASKQEPELADKATQSDPVQESEQTLMGWSIILDGVGVEGIEVGLDGTLSVAVEEETKAPLDCKGGNNEQTMHDDSNCRQYFCDCLQSNHSDTDIE